MGWIVCAVAIVIIPLIAIEPEGRSSFFAFRIVWSLYLSTIVWFAFGSFVLRSIDRKYMQQAASGVSASLGLVLISYATISFGLMLFFAFFTTGDSPNRLHVILQIAAFCLVGILYALISLNSSAASRGLVTNPSNVTTPQMLITLMELKEQRIKETGPDSMLLAKELKNLREFVKYSMSRAGEISTSGDYKTFTGKITDLCNSSVIPCMTEIKDLQKDAKYIAASLKR